ncbi:MAG TPA: NAD(P)/FAD-dependent oxidoreductase [Acidimicrobiales bacterium]|jgi:phytoene dehydrogenase-like protein|nr:NAD(P)/FAD-dependent oxidoreductase [Acidimicrobiales bacterium]
MESTDAVVVGSGPNGLAAALTMARAGLRVEVFEGAATPGGGTRTDALTLPGFRHDVCSSVHPSLVASPFFTSLDLAAFGVKILQPEIAFAHPLASGRAAALYRGVDETADLLGGDAAAYIATVGPLVDGLDAIVPYVLGPMRTMPRHPLTLAHFARVGTPSVRHLSARFTTDAARALLAGTAAHSMEPLTAPLTSAFALLLTALGHGVGWPVVEGGSAAIATALVSELTRLGGRVHTDAPIASLSELPLARAVLLDTSPRQFLTLAGPRLARRQGRPWARFQPGPGTCKVDWALDGPVPWSAAACHRTTTVHVGGTLDEVARSEAEVHAGRHPEHPFVLVVQPSVVDPSRAPAGQHTLWAYCHVPNGSAVDMTERIEAQIERFAPGFRDRVLARATRTATQTEAYNPNFLGGDINGGRASLRQTAFRPVARWNPYRTPLDGTYLCSASTPPGGGVHGMCGYLAARTALRDRFDVRLPPLSSSRGSG